MVDIFGCMLLALIAFTTIEVLLPIALAMAICFGAIYAACYVGVMAHIYGPSAMEVFHQIAQHQREIAVIFSSIILACIWVPTLFNAAKSKVISIASFRAN
jgi:hypothetical protein